MTPSAINYHKEFEAHTTAGLDGVTALPDHGQDGAAQHVYRLSIQLRSRVTVQHTLDQAGEEGLLGEVGI